MSGHEISSGATDGRTGSARRAADRERSERDRQFQAMFDSHHDLVQSVRGDGRIEYVNRTWLRTLGYPEDRDRTVAAVRAFIADPDLGYDVEFRLRHRDGSYRWIYTRGRLIGDAAGRPVRMVGCHVDITERKQLEAQLLQAQKMEAIGRLAGGVAHDFNNLLTAIVGFAGLLEGRLAGDDAGLRDLHEIKAAADRACGLTRRLLAFSREQVMQPRVLDLNGIIRGLVGMLGRIIGEDVELATRLDPAIGAVLADAGQIEQAILNLAVNARDAMPHGGTLTIETANVQLGEGYVEGLSTPLARYAMVTVKDTGVGIDADTRQHLFEPFFTTKEREHGTGLGLATVYGIVKQSGGHVTVDSEPGRGAAFRICLPIVDLPADRASEAAIRPVGRPRASETVLLVEDEAPVRRLARTFLEREGYVVLEADGPAAALDVLSAHHEPIPLLLADVVMPGGGGRGLRARLSVARPDMQVLFMSGFTEDALVRQGVLAAGSAFLEKPFSAESLLSKVREVLDSRPGAGPP